MNSEKHPLVIAAFVIVTLCLLVTVWMQVDDEFAKGVLTLVLGRFLGYVDNIYAFEFGTTRTSSKKDDTIKTLSESLPGQKSGETSIDATGASIHIEKDKS